MTLLEGSAVLDPPVLPDPHRPAEPADVAGAWTRSLLVEADGSRDTTTKVTWLQSGSLYVDLRQPGSGFAGVLHREESAWLWERLVDLQPTGSVDAGLLSWDAGMLVEHGRDEPYLEHWHRDDAPVQPQGGLLLQGADGCCAVLLRVGPHVGWARGSGPLATEISLARFGADGTCTVVRSSLPDRVGLPPLLDLSDLEVVRVEGDPTCLPLPDGALR